MTENLMPSRSHVTWVSIGDWGCKGSAQVQVSKKMKEINKKFVLAVGDNFYEDGVTGMSESTSSRRNDTRRNDLHPILGCESDSLYKRPVCPRCAMHPKHKPPTSLPIQIDPQWKSTFEDVYFHGKGIFRDTEGTPEPKWYCVLGNHDYRGHVCCQIEMTYRGPDGYPWTMPHQYYSTMIDIPNQDKKLGLIVIDTCIMCEKGAERSLHRKWLVDTLKQANKTCMCIVVAGHYPVFSKGAHCNRELVRADNSNSNADFSHGSGSTSDIRTWLIDCFVEHNVDLYVSGHNHNLEYATLSQRHAKHKKLTCIVSGSASKTNTDTSYRCENQGTTTMQLIRGFLSPTSPSPKPADTVDLTNGPLFQTGFFEHTLKADEHKLIHTCHHKSDGSKWTSTQYEIALTKKNSN